jgi:hypothetical protein
MSDNLFPIPNDLFATFRPATSEATVHQLVIRQRTTATLIFVPQRSNVFCVSMANYGKFIFVPLQIYFMGCAKTLIYTEVYIGIYI